MILLDRIWALQDVCPAGAAMQIVNPHRAPQVRSVPYRQIHLALAGICAVEMKWAKDAQVLLVTQTFSAGPITAQ